MKWLPWLFLLNACQPALIRFNAPPVPTPQRGTKTAAALQAAGKETQATISDAQLQHWLDGVTGRKTQP